MNGLVSVVIPVYNAEAYLDACLASVFGQTYRDVEIILVDDGSADGSGAMCDAFAEKDPRVRAFHKTNGGASSARNAGLREAAGEYVYFLDSDDTIAPTLLEKLVCSARENDAELVFFDAWAVDEETGERTEKNYSHKEAYAPDTGVNMMAKMVKNGDFHMGVWQYLAKKAFYDREDLSFVEGIVYEDFLFTCQAYCLAKRVSHVPEFLYERLYHANSVMTAKKTLKYYRSAQTVYERVRDFSAAHGGCVPAAYLVRGAFNAVACFHALSGREKKEARAAYTALRKDILAHGAYGSKPLKMRCYGKLPWAAARAFEKLFG